MRAGRIACYALILLSLVLFIVSSQKVLAQTQARDQAADPYHDIQQEIIALRNEFKQWIQRAEQDQATIQQYIGDKLTELTEIAENGTPSYAERVEKAADVQAAVDSYSATIGALEEMVGTLETTMNAHLDQIETTLADLKVRGIPRQRTAVEPGGVPVPGVTETPEVPEEVPTMQFPPGQLFRAAYGFYMDGDYDTAIAGFQKYLLDYPDTQLAGAAQYWIAESLVKLEEYEIALEEYDRLIAKYPNNDKLPDGYYGKAAVLLKMGRADEARQLWQYVVDHYQGSIAAKKAEDRLQELQ